MFTVSASGVTPRDVARILFRHWRKIALSFCGVIVLTLLVIAVYPRSYASEARLIIRIGRETVGLDPTATTGETIMLQKTQVDEVNSALNILTSREILERVVEQIGAERILVDKPADATAHSDASKPIGSAIEWLRETLVTLRLSDPGTKMDQAVRCLEKKCAATAPKQSTVITLSYRAASPQLAHDVVEAITNVFLEKHSRLNQADGSLEFFSDQAQKLFDDLTLAQEKLRDRKNAYQLTSNLGRRSVLEQSKDAMRQKVYDLQLQENELISRYTDEYPPLKEIRRQREHAEKMLTSARDGGLAANEAASRSTEDAGGERSRTNASPAVLQVAKSAADQEGKLNSELQTLNDQEFELAQLEREVKLLEGKYAMHVEKLEQARVNDALSQERITNVKVAQPATLTYKPVSPKKTLLLAGALVLALCGSLGSAFAAENMDQTLRTTEQVERQLGLPVLASLPYRKRNRAQQRTAISASAASSSTASPPSPNGAKRHSSYGELLTALRSVCIAETGRAKAIGIVGCEGPRLRSRIAGNFAVEAAASGPDPVLLIDADFQRQLIAKRFQLNGTPGWRDVLSGGMAVKNCVHQSARSNLAVMGPGGSNGEAPAAGALDNTIAQLDEIKADYGLIVVDLPPSGEIDGLPDAAKWIDEAVLVVEAERTRVHAAQRAKETLSRAGIQVTGVVLANRRDYIPRWLYRRL